MHVKADTVVETFREQQQKDNTAVIEEKSTLKVTENKYLEGNTKKRKNNSNITLKPLKYQRNIKGKASTST